MLTGLVMMVMITAQPDTDPKPVEVIEVNAKTLGSLMMESKTGKELPVHVVGTLVEAKVTEQNGEQRIGFTIQIPFITEKKERLTGVTKTSDITYWHGVIPKEDETKWKEWFKQNRDYKTRRIPVEITGTIDIPTNEPEQWKSVSVKTKSVKVLKK